MRLDLFLKETRLIKRRTIAKEFCERGLVLVNDKAAKPAYEVKEGDKLLITFGAKKVNIVAHIEQGNKKEKVSYEQLDS